MEEKKINIEDVITFIHTRSTVAERVRLSSELFKSRDDDARSMGRSLSEGQEVQFVGKHGRRVTGRVTKINAKSIHVTSTDGLKWRVSPTLLRPV